MPYTDFNYYQDEFCGRLIPTREDYQSAAIKAKCYLDWLTNGKIETLSELTDEVKHAECAVSELYWDQTARHGIRSETNDGYRVDYFEPNEAEMYRIAVRYLPSSLVYRGIGV